jgi:hypothetical protein
MIKSNIENIGKWSNKEIVVVCDECSIEKEIKFKLYTSYGYKDGDYLCRKCKTKRNNLEKYGVENVFQLKDVKEKSKKTNLEKYGVENISQSEENKNKVKETNKNRYGHEHHMKNKSIKEKSKKTNLEKYGVENISQLDVVKDAKRKTYNENYNKDHYFLTEEHKENIKKINLEKYGVEFSLSSDVIKNKIRKTNLEKYGVDNPSKNEKIKNKIKVSNIKTTHKKILSKNKNILSIDSDNREFNISCDNCNESFNIGYQLYYKRKEKNITICTKCNPIDNSSDSENKLYKFVKSIYDGEVIKNYRLENKEIDVYLPELKMGFEYNGVYWHSELYKGKMYHYNKTNFFKEKSVKIFHIWEDEWGYKNDIIKSMIKNKIGLTKNKIWGRKCEIREISDNRLIKEFLNNNHLQGYTSSSVKLGLFYKNKLVSLMTFRKNKERYELNRFCNIINHNVVGAASKLFKYFKNNYNNNIYTFSDNSYSDGGLYKKLGMKIEYELKPDYRYVINGLRIHKFNYRNKNTDKLIRIYDSGKLKWTTL